MVLCGSKLHVSRSKTQRIPTPSRTECGLPGDVVIHLVGLLNQRAAHAPERCPDVGARLWEDPVLLSNCL